jgi:hypothetical protein
MDRQRSAATERSRETCIHCIQLKRQKRQIGTDMNNAAMQREPRFGWGGGDFPGVLETPNVKPAQRSPEKRVWAHPVVGLHDHETVAGIALQPRGRRCTTERKHHGRWGHPRSALCLECLEQAKLHRAPKKLLTVISQRPKRSREAGYNAQTTRSKKRPTNPYRKWLPGEFTPPALRQPWHSRERHLVPKTSRSFCKATRRLAHRHRLPPTSAQPTLTAAQDDSVTVTQSTHQNDASSPDAAIASGPPRMWISLHNASCECMRARVGSVGRTVHR